MERTYTMPPFIREPAETYHAKRTEYLTAHGLAEFRRCPLLYRKRQVGLLPETVRDAYIIGAAAHCLTLEGRAEFDKRYAVGGPINPKTERPYGTETKAFAEWAAAQGKPVLSDNQFALICDLNQAVRSHDLAATILRDGVAEGVLRGNYCGVACQIRADWFAPAFGVVDLKTCDDIDNFAGDAIRYGYVNQMAFYQDVITDAIDDAPPVHLIAVEKREPFRVGVWRIAESLLEAAAHQNIDGIHAIQLCRGANNWPTGYEAIRTLGENA